eukprot:c27473_g1_i1.p1 GENE.c27473_g1_i1~~c27473_g1_i1.p1  ORF type:complete len:149 (-),score=48.37 c27473_g1_i1:13-459(-)
MGAGASTTEGVKTSTINGDKEFEGRFHCFFGDNGEGSNYSHSQSVHIYKNGTCSADNFWYGASDEPGSQTSWSGKWIVLAAENSGDETNAVLKIEVTENGQSKGDVVTQEFVMKFDKNVLQSLTPKTQGPIRFETSVYGSGVPTVLKR